MPLTAANRLLIAEQPDDAYDTSTVETHDGEWTAEISRVEKTTSGSSERISALVDVGSISHLIDAIKNKR